MSILPASIGVLGSEVTESWEVLGSKPRSSGRTASAFSFLFFNLFLIHFTSQPQRPTIFPYPPIGPSPSP